MNEVIFEVHEGDVDGGWTAHALGFGIHTEADSLDKLRTNAREAVECCFEDASRPKLIRLHFVRDEVLTA